MSVSSHTLMSPSFEILKSSCNQSFNLLLGFFFNVIFCLSHQEFEESGDPEKHYEDLFSLAKEGIQKGKVIYLLI